jgi:hypothetical protein
MPVDIKGHLAERNAPHGTYARVRDQLAAMEESGLGRFYLQTFGRLDPAEMGRTLTGVQG